MFECQRVFTQMVSVTRKEGQLLKIIGNKISITSIWSDHFFSERTLLIESPLQFTCFVSHMI